MSEIIKKQAPIILAEIKKAKSILLHCHPSPDPDSVGSALAMKLALEQLGKKATLIQGDSIIPEAFIFPGVDTIVKKSYGEIDINEFDLFIILDSGSINMVSAKTQIAFPENLMTIVIDHHASNKGYGKINLVDASYPATGQLLYDLLKEMGIKLDHDISLNLFMGIYSDTGGFKYENTSHETFLAGAELVKFIPDFHKYLFAMTNNRTKESLQFQGYALSSLKTYLDGNIGIANVTHTQLTELHIEEATKDQFSAAMIANEIKSVVGLNIGVCVVEIESGRCKASFRTRDSEKFDVSRLATVLGGGGHKAAAAVLMLNNPQEAIEKIVKTAKELYNL